MIVVVAVVVVVVVVVVAVVVGSCKTLLGVQHHSLQAGSETIIDQATHVHTYI